MGTSAIRRRTVLLAAAGGVLALTPGCSAGRPQADGPPTSPGSSSPTGTGSVAAVPRTPSLEPSATAAPSARPATPPPDPAAVRANEVGVVPVMMYHRITDQPGEYDMTPAGFRRQVRRLLRSGYRPVDLDELAHGRVDVPAGTTPVVLTFDDGSPGQFSLRADGSLDPACGAGILAAECAKVRGATPRATFYVNRDPFGLTSRSDQARALGVLLERGFTLGNHTLDHANLATLSDRGVAREFVELERLVARVAPSARLRTMALPFGVEPRNRALARRGSWHDTSYAFDVTLLVGANPSPSPFADDFDPHAVPRIRGTSWHGGRTPLTGTYWLDWLDAHRSERYVSAGNPGHVTVPKRLRSQVAGKYHDRLVTY